MRKRVGLFGGTFNPLHNGHLFLALEACHLAKLEKIYFVPNRLPPHKEEPSVSAEKRLEMLLAATEGVAEFEVSRVEMAGEGPSYTFDTLQKFAPEQELTFLCGVDAFLVEWYRLEAILERLSTLLIANRAGLSFEMPAQLKALPTHLREKIQLMTFPDIAISSTDIRDRIVQGRPFRFLIPEPVYRIITESGLYGAKVSKANKNDADSKFE